MTLHLTVYLVTTACALLSLLFSLQLRIMKVKPRINTWPYIEIDAARAKHLL